MRSSDTDCSGYLFGVTLTRTPNAEVDTKNGERIVAGGKLFTWLYVAKP
jgi:hypothetical protein